MAETENSTISKKIKLPTQLKPNTIKDWRAHNPHKSDHNTILMRNCVPLKKKTN